MDYHHLYKKYAQQYRRLKGGDNETLVDDLTRPKTFFEKMTNMYIMVHVTNPNIRKTYDIKIQKLLGPKNRPHNDVLHITLLHIMINADHPLAEIFRKHDFLQHVRKSYNESMSTLLIPKENKLLGIDTKFIARRYAPLNTNAISHFRTLVYTYLNKRLGTFTQNIEEIKGLKYYVFSFGGKELYAITEYHHGKGNWAPHISVVSVPDIKKYNLPLYKEITKCHIQENVDECQEKVIANKINNITDKKIPINKESELVVSFFNLFDGNQQHEVI